MANWTHHRARLNGLEVHYVEQGHGPVVLLLHGFPHTWFSWRHQIGHLADAGYRVVAPDLRGMGQTSAPEPVEEYRVDRITGDLCALLDHLGVATAVCSGLDFGMYAAYDLALDHPERVRGLIGLQNPFHTASDRPPLEVERRRGRKRFSHVSYFVDEPDAAVADMNATRGRFSPRSSMLSPARSTSPRCGGFRRAPPIARRCPSHLRSLGHG